MKKKETGAKTKKDPDSRINKSLRKWNCKCGSAQVALDIFAKAAKEMKVTGYRSNYGPGDDSNPDPDAKSEQDSRDEHARQLQARGATTKPQFKLKPVANKKNASVALAIFAKQAKQLSWGGQRWQLGQAGINPQLGYRYFAGVVPTPDIGLRIGAPGAGVGMGLAPLPYFFADSGQPSGRFARSPRSLWKAMSDGFRSPEDSFFLELAGIEQGAGPERYEKLLRDRAIGSSSEEIRAIAQALSESEDVRRQALTKRLPAGVNKLLPHFNPANPKSLYAAQKGKQAPLINKIVAYQVDKAKQQAGQQKQAILGWSKVKPVDVASTWYEMDSNKPNQDFSRRNVYLPARRAATPRLLNRLFGDDPRAYYDGMSMALSEYPEYDIYKGHETDTILNRVNVAGESLKMWRPDIFKNSPRWDARLNTNKSTPQIIAQLKKDVIEDAAKAQQQGRPVDNFEIYLTDAADAKKKPKKKAPAKSKSK